LPIIAIPNISRQGGSSTNWSTAGTNSYSEASTLIQAGAVTTSSSARVTVTFPTAFSQVPVVFASTVDASVLIFANIETISATTFTIDAFNMSSARVVALVVWTAIGKA
jgi:hypothetical protein